MIKILTIVGARPQIIKAAALSRVIREEFASRIQELLLHTGQHYDEAMSDVFFRELGLPVPDYKLESKPGHHGARTAEMLRETEEILLKENPDAVLVYGDTNSTLAGSLAASKLHIPVVHVEAGLRSFNKETPEEINRIFTDHVSTLLFTPVTQGVENLKKEGLNINNTPPFHIDNPGIFHCGDVMYDNARYFARKAVLPADLPEQKKFALATVHREVNTDKAENLESIMTGLVRASESTGLVCYLPVHPRLKNKLEKLNLPVITRAIDMGGLILAPPASYFQIIGLLSKATLVFTDSGGLQKEAFFFKKPVVVLREETEWTELVSNGNNLLAGADTSKIVSMAGELMSKNDFTWPAFYGDGEAALFIARTLLQNFTR